MTRRDPNETVHPVFMQAMAQLHAQMTAAVAILRGDGPSDDGEWSDPWIVYATNRQMEWAREHGSELPINQTVRAFNRKVFRFLADEIASATKEPTEEQYQGGIRLLHESLRNAVDMAAVLQIRGPRRTPRSYCKLLLTQFKEIHFRVRGNRRGDANMPVADFRRMAELRLRALADFLEDR